MSDLPNHKKNVGVIGPYLFNGGDYMMLECIINNLSDCCNLVLSKHHRDYSTAWSSRTGRMIDKELMNPIKFSLLYKYLPRSLRHYANIIFLEELDYLIDCSGFQYGDQFEKQYREKKKRLQLYQRLARKNVRIIFLPQAFGPFKNPLVREVSKKIFDLAQHIYARDEESYNYLQELSLDTKKLGRSPDITAQLTGTSPTNPQEWHQKVAIVPNSRMLDRTSNDIAHAYIQFNVNLVEVILKKGFKPYILIHELYDLKLAKTIVEKCKVNVEIVQVNPIEAKGLLACSYGVISSRYHAIISSITSGTPTFSTSWSHKYDCLLQEYDISETLLSPVINKETLEEKLNLLFDKSRREKLIDKINLARDRHKRAVQDMWGEIKTSIDGTIKE